MLAKVLYTPGLNNEAKYRTNAYTHYQTVKRDGIFKCDSKAFKKTMEYTVESSNHLLLRTVLLL